MRAPIRQAAMHSWRFLVEVGVTAFFWGLWAYLVTPLLSLLLWYLGFRLFFEEMVVRSGYQAFLEQLENYGLVVLAMLIVTLAWVIWNRRRYGGASNTRTHALASVSLMESADAAGLAPEELEEMQVCKRLTVDFGASDCLILRGCSAAESRLEQNQGARVS